MMYIYSGSECHVTICAGFASSSSSSSLSSRLLLGAEDSFVYTVGQEGVGVRRGVQLSHLTPVSEHHMRQYAICTCTMYIYIYIHVTRI